MKGVIILAVTITAVLGIDPRCLQKTENDSPHIPHEIDCRKYYTCGGNKFVTEHECVNGFEFNPITLKCDWPRGFCTRTNMPVQNVMSCNGISDGAYYPDLSDDCKSYYRCKNGIAKISECAAGTRFDIHTRKCIDEVQVQCTASSRVIDCSNSLINSSYFVSVTDGCKSYTKCENGKSVESFCEGSLVFNIQTKTCDWPQKVLCGKGATITARSIGSDETHFKDFDSMICISKRNGQIVGPNRNSKCASYFTCQNGQLEEHYCGDRLIFNSKIGICDLPENVKSCQLAKDNSATINCMNKHDLRYKHPSDCAAFILCHLGQAYLQKCAKGLMFDSVKHTCVRDVAKVCLQSQTNSDEYLESLIETPLEQNSQKIKTFVNYANGCRSYFECKSTHCKEKFCLRNFAYSMEKLRCEPEDAVFCDTITAVEGNVNDRNLTIKSRSMTSNVDCDDGHGKWYEDPSDFTKFYVCAAGRAVRQQCHAGQCFDKERKECKTDTCGRALNCVEGSRVPDNLSANKYYQCVGGTLQSQQCASGLTYDIQSGCCVQQASCCPGNVPQGGIVPNTMCPNKYFICNNGVLVEQTCVLGQEFNPITKCCTWISQPVTPAPVTIPPPNYDCGSYKQGSMMVDSKNQNKYYVCLHGSFLQQTCPSGMNFNPETLYCVAGPTTPPPGSCGPYPEHSHVPFCNDTSIYLVCIRGVFVVQYCKENTQFNPDSGVCTPTTIIPNQPSGRCGIFDENDVWYSPTSPFTYTQCIKGVINTLKCPQNQIFDSMALFCRNPCAQLGAGGTTAADPNNPQNYYVCPRPSTGDWTVACPAGKYYYQAYGGCLSLPNCPSGAGTTNIPIEAPNYPIDKTPYYLHCYNGIGTFQKCPAGATMFQGQCYGSLIQSRAIDGGIDTEDLKSNVL